LDDSAASLTNKSGRGRRMREGGKWEKKLRDRKRQSGPDSLELPALRESQIQPSEWVCVWVSMCVCAQVVCLCAFTETCTKTCTTTLSAALQ